MAANGLTTFEVGESITAASFREKLNAVAQQASDGVSWNFGFGIAGQYTTGSGFSIAIDQSVFPEVRREAFFAKITAAATTEGGYEWQEQRVTDENAMEEFPVADGGRIGRPVDEGADPPVTVSTLAYDLNGNKRIRVDTIVVVWEVEDTTGALRYWIDTKGGSDFVLAKITAYSGSTYSWEEVDSDGLTVTGGMTGANNLKEINGRQGIPSGTVVMIWPGEADDEWWMDQAEGKDTSAEVIPDPTGEVPEDSSWDRESQGSSRGVSVGVVAQVYYNETSGQLVYRMRTLTFDSSGRLTKVSLLSIDKDITTAEDCPAPE